MVGHRELVRRRVEVGIHKGRLTFQRTTLHARIRSVSDS
jgi:hypothetical protein